MVNWFTGEFTRAVPGESPLLKRSERRSQEKYGAGLLGWFEGLRENGGKNRGKGVFQQRRDLWQENS